LEDLGEDGKMITKRILKKQGERALAQDGNQWWALVNGNKLSCSSNGGEPID
jgi:hypothetical protein